MFLFFFYTSFVCISTQPSHPPPLSNNHCSVIITGQFYLVFSVFFPIQNPDDSINKNWNYFFSMICFFYQIIFLYFFLKKKNTISTLDSLNRPLKRFVCYLGFFFSSKQFYCHFKRSILVSSVLFNLSNLPDIEFRSERKI